MTIQHLTGATHGLSDSSPGKGNFPEFAWKYLKWDGKNIQEVVGGYVDWLKTVSDSTITAAGVPRDDGQEVKVGLGWS